VTQVRVAATATRAQRLRRILAGVLAVVLGLALTGVAFALTRSTSAQGRPLVSGGVSYEELQALHARRDDYSFWVVTAAKRSGAYLADVRLKIVDSDKRTVFEGLLDGPWLFIDLTLGRYSIEATFNGQTQRTVTNVHPGDHHQAFFYFDVPDEVSPEWQSPFERNPFGK
jgi:hypothetical protein